MPRTCWLAVVTSGSVVDMRGLDPRCNLDPVSSSWSELRLVLPGLQPRLTVDQLRCSVPSCLGPDLSRIWGSKLPTGMERQQRRARSDAYSDPNTHIICCIVLLLSAQEQTIVRARQHTTCACGLLLCNMTRALGTPKLESWNAWQQLLSQRPWRFQAVLQRKSKNNISISQPFVQTAAQLQTEKDST